MQYFWFAVAALVLTLLVAAVYEMIIVDLETQLLAGAAEESLDQAEMPFNVVDTTLDDDKFGEVVALSERRKDEHPYQRSTAYEAELMAEIEEAQDGYDWPMLDFDVRKLN